MKAKSISVERLDTAVNGRRSIIRRSLLETIAEIERDLSQMKTQLEQDGGPHITNESCLLRNLPRIGERLAAWDEVGYINSHVRD